MSTFSASSTAQTDSNRRLVILTEGHSEPLTAKTAACVIRYRPQDVVALFDTTQQGKTAQELLGVGGDLPVIGALSEAPDANALLIGIAPSGGRLPPDWRPILIEAMRRRMDIISGMHEFLADDPELSAAARDFHVQLIDVRRSHERDVARRQGIREDCLRIQTVGNDCSVGKMVAALEIAQGLRQQGCDAQFVATGQTGIMIAGDGCAVDCVVSDFVSGAAEKLVLRNQQHDVLLIEGQGSLAHPMYACVTLGLLHGCLPHGLVLCYEVGRTTVHGMEEVSLVSLSHLKSVYETMANLMHPCRVIGVAMNSRRVSAEQAEEERVRLRDEMGLPVCDVFRHGPDDLVDAVLRLREEVIS